MFYIRAEGEKFKGFGFHFYPLSDPSNFGFIFNTDHATYWFRYSKIIKKFSPIYHPRNISIAQ